MRITREMLQANKACYSDEQISALGPPEGLTIQQVLDLPISADNVVWVATRPGVLDDRTLRLFACRCALRTLRRVRNRDPRSVAAVETAERFARGNATTEELADAETSARAAFSATRGRARFVSWTAMWAVETMTGKEQVHAAAAEAAFRAACGLAYWAREAAKAEADAERAAQLADLRELLGEA